MPARVVNYSYTPAKLYPTDEAYPEEVDYDDGFDPIGDYYLPEDWCKLNEYDLEDIAFDV